MEVINIFNKKFMMLSILFVALLAISAVSAADNITDDSVSMENDDVNHVELANDSYSFEENVVDDENLNDDGPLKSNEKEEVVSQAEDDDVLGASPPYTAYSVSVSDTTMYYGSSGTITITVSPASGYSYAYDFYLRVIDSSGTQKINKNYYSSTSTTKITHTISATELPIGTYTIKLVNYADSHVMDTATLTVKSVPYSAYSVSVSDTTVNYGVAGSIYMTISPASSSYYYRYDFYLKVYDSNNNEKISNRYYSTSSATSKTYSLSSTQLQPGIYTIKIINNVDSHVMDTATLTVQTLPYSAYSVSVSDTTVNYGSGGNIYMSISPASSSYNNKYDFYLKVYDSNNNEKISNRYYSTTSATSVTYSLSSTQLSAGTYTIKILNYYDSHVMDTATLTVQTLPYSAYSVSVSDTTVNYGSGGNIYMSISPASSSYNNKYDFYLKVYDSSGSQIISSRYYSTSSSTSETYSLSSTQLEQGIYTIKIVNYYDSHVMDTATLTVLSVPYSAYSVSVSDTSVNYGSSGSIYMSISPASSSYYYKYDYYLKVYDSNNNEKISNRYYSTSSATSRTYSLSSTQLEPGTYTIKIINNVDNHVMDTATLTVKSVPYSAYSVSVDDYKVVYGNYKYIYMDISPASGYNYKYDYYFKVYDSSNNEKISQRFYSTYSSYQESYYLSGSALSQGAYTIKIINTNDNHLMDSAKLYIIDEDFSVYCDYYYYVNENINIDYTISNKATGSLNVYLNDKYVKSVSVGNAIDLGKLDSGDYTVKVTYDGNQYLPSFEDSTSFHVSKLPLDYYTDYDLVAGTGGTVKFIFEEPSTGRISVYFPDFPSQNSFSSNIVNGQASITVLGVPAGDYEYELTYSGNDQYESSSSGYINVDYRQSPITVNVPEANWGEEISITPSLPKGATGYVELYIDNVFVYNMSVGKTYKFSGVNGGEHTLRIKYSGDNYYLPNQTTQKFKIKRFDTTVSINNTIMANPSSLLKVTLNKEANGHIKVSLNGYVYEGDVKNGTFTFYANYLSKGSYNAIIDYQGDAKYNPFSVAREIVSVAKDPNINLQLKNILVNNNIVIKPTVNSTASGSLNIYVDGSYKTAISIGESYTLNKPSVGKHEVLIKYAGNSYYDSGNVTVTFRVFTRDPIVANDMKIVYGTDNKFQATFYDEYGNLLNNTFVQFNVNGTDYPVKTNEYGVAKLNVNLPAGNYKVTSISLLDESQVNNLLVFHSVFAENTVLEYGSPNKFKATFLDETASPLSNTGIIFIVDGVTQPMIMTDVNGIAYLNSTLSLGKHTITSFNTMTNQEMTNDVMVVSSIDGIMKVNDIRDINYGQKATVTVNIGNSYLNGDVEIIVTNTKGFTQTFNQRASRTITRELSNLPAGKYTVYVNYKSSADELVLKLNKTFTVNKIDPTLNYVIYDAAYGDSVEIDVSVPNSNGTVSFRVDGSTYSATLENGKLVKFISGLSKGSHVVDIIFDGDNNYNPLMKTDNVNIYTRMNVEYDSIFIISDESVYEQQFTITNIAYEDNLNLALYIDGKQIMFEDYYVDDDYLIECYPSLSEGRHHFEIKRFDSDQNIIGYKSGYFDAINWKHYGGSNFQLVTNKTATYIPNKNITWYVKKVGTRDGDYLYLSTFNHNGNTYTLINGLGYPNAHSPVFRQFNPDEYVMFDGSYYKLVNGAIVDVIQSSRYEVVDGIYYEYIGRFSDSESYYTIIDGKCYKYDGFYHEATYGVDYKIVNGYYYTMDGERIYPYDGEFNGEIIDGTRYYVDGNYYYALTPSTLGDDLLRVNDNLYLLVHGDFDDLSQKYLNDYVVVGGKLYNVVNGNVGTQIQLKQSAASSLILSLGSSSADIKLPNDATGSVTLNIVGKNYVGYLKNGAATIRYPNLAPGVYMYTITYSGDGKYAPFTKTSSFTVKKIVAPTKIKLTLKKVKIKKSAKKLVLQATLKINGKAVKGKVVKFKFNKKTYKAKTNKKGVAKVTIKKSALKKLKVGKKITYTAAYGKTVVKKNVKVKK